MTRRPRCERNVRWSRRSAADARHRSAPWPHAPETTNSIWLPPSSRSMAPAPCRLRAGDARWKPRRSAGGSRPSSSPGARQTSWPRRSACPAPCKDCSREPERRLPHRRRTRASRPDHRPRPGMPRIGRRGALRPPRPSAAASIRPRGRREDRRRHRRTSAARSGSDLLPARRKGARRQDRRPAEVGRSRSSSTTAAPRRSSCTSKACRSRSCPGIPAGIGAASYAGVPLTYPGGGDTLTFVRGHEDDGKTRAGGRLGEPGAARRHHRLLRGTGTAAAHAAGADRPRAVAGRFGGAHLRRHAADAGDDARNARRDRAGSQGVRGSAPGNPRRRPRRGAARAPALVRRAAAVRQARARHAAARPGRRDGRGCSRRSAPKRSRRR